LTQLGYSEGTGVVYEVRAAEGQLDRLPGFAAELVSKGVDVIVSYGGPPTNAARKATTTIPIVFTLVADPVAIGVARTAACIALPSAPSCANATARFAAGGYPLVHGEQNQERAIWGVLAWATAETAIKGLVVYEAGDYYTVRGLRAPGGRLRPSTAAILRAEQGLRSSAQ